MVTVGATARNDLLHLSSYKHSRAAACGNADPPSATGWFIAELGVDGGESKRHAHRRTGPAHIRLPKPADHPRHDGFNVSEVCRHQGAVLLTVRRSYVGNDVTHSTLLDRASACPYENLPKYRSYRVSNTAPRHLHCCTPRSG